ncbi:Glycine oxidase [wastewater metagenome]|uniref:Glycine oxidase n=2 Tax=unclassified sequences TaxID=12908 RepID=A0A5B8RB84_9ZZZZ|nr:MULTISPECIES: FAD-binding oxidoreductase [Arhodomonas]QEA05956.1 glycine oxidase [uncultured organism]
MAVDCIVIGTGIIGSFTALALHERGLSVAVADRGGLAPGTSRSSDGNLLSSDKSGGVMLTLSERSLVLWSDFAARHGNHCEYDPKGSTVVARGADQAEALAEHVAGHQTAGVTCEFVDAGWERYEPHLGPDTSAIGHWPRDAQVQPMLACYQIARSLSEANVPYRFYDEITALEPGADAVTVRFANGDTWSAGHVVLATGVWSNELLEPLGLSVPVRPRKGHICVLERGDVEVNSKIADFGYNATAEDTSGDDAAVQTAAIIESTRSGTILCGSSREFAGFDRSVSTDTLRRVMADCIGIVPDLARLRVLRAYAGLRPFSPDGLPIIGPVDPDGRIVVATGHEGAGHGLAPVTGELVADLIAAGVTHPYDGALHPERFTV